MTALLEKAWGQVSQLPEAEQDTVAAQLMRALVALGGENAPGGEKPRPQFGSARGMFTLTPDFDDPITDFEE